MNNKIITRQNISYKRLIIYILMIMALIAYLFPILWEISTSLKENSEVLAGYNLLPKVFNLDSYYTALTRFNVAKYLLNTVIVAFFITSGTVLSCSLAGYAFGQLSFPGKNTLFFLYLSTMMIPASVTLVPSYFIILKLGFANTFFALIMPFFFGSAFGTFLMRQFYMTIQKELVESAKLDGANFWQIWWHIMLPLSKPALATLAVMTLVAQWNSFLWPLVVINSPAIKVLSVGLSDFRLFRNILWNQLMAAVMIGSFPMILILLAAQKYFIRGIQFSGVNR